jgi:hypothetical protein
MLGKLYVLSFYYALCVLFFDGSICRNVSDYFLVVRDNRMDLTHEPPTTYLPTVNTSLGVMSTPTPQYVFSVHFPNPEQQCQ